MVVTPICVSRNYVSPGYGDLSYVDLIEPTEGNKDGTRQDRAAVSGGEPAGGA